MSGGWFDYKQHYLNDILVQIEEELSFAKGIPPDAPPFLYGHACKESYTPLILDVMEQVRAEASVLYEKIHRLDWVLSGDSGEETLALYATTSPAKVAPNLGGNLGGDLVYIDWVDPDDDWHWFRLLVTKGEWLFLQGADDPDGTKHDGDSFWVHRNDISSIRETK